MERICASCGLSYKAGGKKYCNMQCYMRSGHNPAKTPTARQRMSQFKKGVPQTDEMRRKRSETMRRRLQEPEMIAKWSAAKIGHKPSQETKDKISKSHAMKPKTQKTLRNKLDNIFSRYIRWSYADKDGMVKCFTCSKVLPIKEMDNGHFVGRACLSLRYSEKNCHPQCRYCNRYAEGMKDVYALRLIEKYGPDVLVELNREKYKIVKNYPYQEQIDLYKAKLDELNEKATRNKAKRKVRKD